MTTSAVRKLGTAAFSAALLAITAIAARAQESSEVETGAGDAAAGGIAAALSLAFNCVGLVLAIVAIVGMWKVFEKAGKPGWAAIVPIYNIIVLCEIVGRPLWWVVLLLVPCVNIVAAVILSIDLARSFGQSAGYGIGLAFLSFIFYPMLGFGPAQYVGPAAAQGTPTASGF